MSNRVNDRYNELPTATNWLGRGLQVLTLVPTAKAIEHGVDTLHNPDLGSLAATSIYWLGATALFLQGMFVLEAALEKHEAKQGPTEGSEQIS